MKNLFLIILSFVLFNTSYANENKYLQSMQKGFELLKEAKTSKDLLIVSEYFKKIESNDFSVWLPIYYSSYSTFFAGIYEDNKEIKDQLFDRALVDAEKILITNENGSEVYTLQAYIKLMKISVKPMPRAVSGTGKAMELIKKAIELNPENPRPYFVKGQNTFYTPSMFGGGPEKAKPFFLEAKTKYEKDANIGSLLPIWGKTRNNDLYNKCP